MDWLIWVAGVALFIGLWHEFNRFPAANKSFYKLQDRLGELESENQDLKQKIEFLENDVQSLSEQIERIKDPEYCRALDEGDGEALYELDKARGNIE